jgi:phage tail sheath protein FI
MPTYDVPGVYIEELTSPGVITGVSTSTAAFIGPALQGPLNEARRISSYDEFLQTYANPLPDGTFQPFITTPNWFYLAHSVRGFYDNGGKQAYIVRVGSALAATWVVKNEKDEEVFRVQASKEGVAGDQITIQVLAANATTLAGDMAATGTGIVQLPAAAAETLVATLDDATPFRVGDIVTKDESERTAIRQIQGNVITLSSTIKLGKGDKLRIADILKDQNTFRMAKTDGLWPGSVVRFNNADDYAVIQAVDRVARFVTLAPSPARTKTYKLDPPGSAPTLVSQEFQLLVTPPAKPIAAFDNLSLNPLHPNYVFSAVSSDWVKIVAPSVPPLAATYPDAFVKAVGALGPPTVKGKDDDPGSVAATDYQAGLDILRNLDGVNVLCIPDAAAHAEYKTIQLAMINHCLALRDRIAVLDSRAGEPVSGPGSIQEHRQAIQSERGFAALYYPWLQVRDPFSTGPIPRRMLVPPSGAIAGVYARTDNERGVHKAPANTDVRGILGLERILSDGQQGPLNLDGINVLRIFPGTGQAVVWGARTTVRTDITDWIYVNVRRLMIYIEQSIEQGIRWAVFEPNGLPLWQKLKRTINEFLTRVWRDGGLFGATADKAFYVRIDEGLNPPSTRALGRLYIEIGVAVVRPAEFIIVRIGLWDGGAQISEQ